MHRDKKRKQDLVSRNINENVFSYNHILTNLTDYVSVVTEANVATKTRNLQKRENRQVAHLCRFSFSASNCSEFSFINDSEKVLEIKEKLITKFPKTYDNIN